MLLTLKTEPVENRMTFLYFLLKKKFIMPEHEVVTVKKCLSDVK